MCILFPGEPMSDETIDDLMKTIDKDQDGKIGYRGKTILYNKSRKGSLIEYLDITGGNTLFTSFFILNLRIYQ